MAVESHLVTSGGATEPFEELQITRRLGLTCVNFTDMFGYQVYEKICVINQYSMVQLLSSMLNACCARALWRALEVT